MKYLPISFTIKPACLLPLLALSLLFITGCSQFANSSMSDEYVAGMKLADIYAKDDAINDRCINYPVSLSSNIMNNTRKHLDQLKGTKSSDFISGFSRGYNDEYRQYADLYCGNLDSSEEYMKE